MLKKLLLCCVLCCLAFTSANAEQPKLSKFEYTQLTKAHKLLENGQWRDARKLLKEAKGKVKSDYAKALVAHNLAQIALQNEQYKTAIKHLLEVKKLNALPEDQQVSISHTLGQLYGSEHNWKSCISHMKQWMAAVPNKVKANDNLLVAQAHAQLEQWKSVIPYITRAIRSKRVAPENWYLLKVAAHIQLKQWKSAVKQQQVVIQHYANKASHWRQLVSLQMQAGQRKSALATQRLGFSRKLLRKESDYILLAQMLLNQQVPYQAGVVLEEGLKAKAVKGKIRNLRLLSQAWIMSKEHDKAIRILKRINRIAPSEKTSLLLAQIQLQTGAWSGVKKTLKVALQNKPKKSAQMYLLLGIAQLNLKHFQAARSAFEQAGKSSKYAKSVANWMQYLDQMNAANEVRG